MEPYAVEKPWGTEVVWALTDRYCAKVLHVVAGRRLSLQYHREKDETLYCWEGEGLIRVGPRVLDFLPGAAWRIEARQTHRIEAVTPLTVFEVSTPEVGDVVRVEDDYGR